MQRKRTLYPEWNTCFDAHLHEGRVIQMVLMERPNKSVSDISIGAKMLADKCTDGQACRCWVSAWGGGGERGGADKGGWGGRGLCA